MGFLFVVFDCTFHALFLFACCCYGLADLKFQTAWIKSLIKLICPGYKGSGQLHNVLPANSMIDNKMLTTPQARLPQ